MLRRRLFSGHASITCMASWLKTVLQQPLGPNVQNAHQRKQAPRRVMIGGKGAGEAFLQSLGPFVVQAAASHVDGLDLVGLAAGQSLCVAAANVKIGPDDRHERARRQAKGC